MGRSSKVLFSLSLIFVNQAYACFTPKQHQMSSPEELVSRSKDIVIAKLISSKVLSTYVYPNKRVDTTMEYTLGIEEVLKGTSSGDIVIKGHKFESSDENDFKKHSSSEFWNATGGRSDIESDCTISPGFAKEKRYLIFLDKPYHFKSFEQINSSDDKWLVKVKELISSGNSNLKKTNEEAKGVKE